MISHGHTIYLHEQFSILTDLKLTTTFSVASASGLSILGCPFGFL